MICVPIEGRIKWAVRGEMCVCMAADVYAQTVRTAVSAYEHVCKAAKESQLGHKKEESTNDMQRQSETEIQEEKKAPTMLFSSSFPPLTPLCVAPTQQECTG